MGRIILRALCFLLSNIADILILCGATIFVVAFFIYVSKFAGMMALSAVLIILGLIISKINLK